MTTLFEYLGIAGQERIHTQTLAWLLTPGGVSPLSVPQRVKLLQALGAPCNESQVKELRVLTELMSLDLVAHTPDGDVFLVLENKIKSRQTWQQLPRYEKILPKVGELLGIGSAKPKKVFLTLSKEIAGGSWTDIDYAAVAVALDAAHPNPYVSDYAKVLGHIVDARDAFVKDHRRFPEILKRIAWSTTDRLKIALSDDASAVERFVCVNRLERIFVETLFRKVASAFPDTLVDAGMTGMPLIQAKFWHVDLGGVCYRAGLQLQNGSLKLNIANVNYERSMKGPDLSILDPYFVTRTRKENASKTKDYRSWSWRAGNELLIQKSAIDDCRMAFENACIVAKGEWHDALQDLRRSGIAVNHWPWTSERELARMGESTKCDVA